MAKSEAGKGTDPEKGWNRPKYREGYDAINWGHKPKKPRKVKKPSLA